MVLQVREGTVELPDGRTLEYADWGSRHGAPVIYCHGSPGSRWEINLPLKVVEASGLEVRILAMNRPGFGQSTFKAGRSFSDWPHDVAAAADQLGIGSFGVLGASGGGPYALVCGHELGDRITRIGVVVGSCPAIAPGMEGSLALTGPARNRLIRRLQYGMIGWAVRTGRIDSVVERGIAALGSVDRKAMADPDLRQWFADLFAEAFVDLGRGAAYEQGLYLRDWDFDIGAVTHPTWLWYSGEDANIPAEAGRWLADQLPNAHFAVWRKHGHFTWANSSEVVEVVATVAGRVDRI